MKAPSLLHRHTVQSREDESRTSSSTSSKLVRSKGKGDVLRLPQQERDIGSMRQYPFKYSWNIEARFLPWIILSTIPSLPPTMPHPLQIPQLQSQDSRQDILETSYGLWELMGLWEHQEVGKKLLTRVQAPDQH